MVASLVPPQAPPIVRPTLDTLRKKLRAHFPDGIRIEHVISTEDHVHPISHLRLSNGQCLLLKVVPNQTTALLRRERRSLGAEAEVLSLLRPLRDPHIPQIIEPDTHPFPANPPFLLRHLIPGVPLPEIESSLKPRNRENIDWMLGALARLVGHQRSKSFGCVSRVSSGSGCSTWRNAFLGLIESTLQDAEDTFISLQYGQIRHEIYRLAPALDFVTHPKLVIVDMGKKAHIILNPETKHLSGIVDFSWAVWGDLLMAEAFESPSAAFFEGFGSSHPKDKSERIRLLLYNCYRHLHRIVEQFYRYQNQDDELRARKKLTEILKEMVAASC